MSGTGVLVAMASRLPCQYPADPCDTHRLRHGHRDEEGFTRCLNCQIRDEAQRLGEQDRVGR